MTCKTCKFLEVEPGKRVTSRKAYRCLAPVVLPALPISITESFGWHWPPPRSWVRSDDGADCPTYEARTP